MGWLLLAAPTAVQAQFTYRTNADNTLTVTAYTGGDNNVLIPATIDGLPVSSIGTNAFSSDNNLEGLTISASVTNIGADAFEGCPYLADIYFTGNVPTADATAFVSSPDATVYYAPSTAGWNSTFDGLETIQDYFGYNTNADITLTITY